MNLVGGREVRGDPGTWKYMKDIERGLMRVRSTRQKTWTYDPERAYATLR